MAKKRVIRCLIIILTIVLAAGVEMFWLSRRKTIKQYKESQAAFGNPLMGYVPSAWYNEVSEDISLLYMDITWAELEPEEGVGAIGSGGAYAQSAALALVRNTDLVPAVIVGKALEIAGDLCIYTNKSHIIETLD